MRVFVAGASGAIGRPFVVNALDAEAVTAAIARIRPDGIIDELTSLPRRYTPEEMRIAAPRDRQIRLEEGGNLNRAALETGVKRYIVQSSGFFYGRGRGLASEEDPLAHDAPPGVAGSVAAYTQIENRVFGSPRLEGVALAARSSGPAGQQHIEHTLSPLGILIASTMIVIMIAITPSLNASSLPFGIYFPGFDGA